MKLLDLPNEILRKIVLRYRRYHGKSAVIALVCRRLYYVHRNISNAFNVTDENAEEFRDMCLRLGVGRKYVALLNTPVDLSIFKNLTLHKICMYKDFRIDNLEDLRYINHDQIIYISIRVDMTVALKYLTNISGLQCYHAIDYLCEDLCQLKNMQMLDISIKNDLDINFIQHMPKLISLNASNLSVSTLPHVNPSMLNFLDISLSADNVIDLSVFINLKGLRLNVCNVEHVQPYIDQICKLRSLQRLTINNFCYRGFNLENFKKVDITPLSKIRCLGYLSLYNLDIMCQPKVFRHWETSVGYPKLCLRKCLADRIPSVYRINIVGTQIPMDVIQSVQVCRILLLEGKYFSDWKEVDNLYRRSVFRTIEIHNTKHLGDIPNELSHLKSCVKCLSGILIAV